MSWRSSSRTRRRLFGLVVPALIASALLAQPVSAHTTLVETEPADGATLETPPHEIRLTFDGALVPDLLVASVVDGDGREVPGVSVSVEQVVYVVIALPDLPRGAYRVSWHAVSALDRHVTTGTIVFDVGQLAGRVPPPPEPDLLPAWASVARVFELIGFALLAGALILLTRGSAGGRSHAPLAARRLRRIVGGGAILAVGAGVVRNLVDGAELAGLGASTWAGAWLPDLAAAVAIGGAVLLSRSAARRARRQPDAVPDARRHEATRSTLLTVASVLVLFAVALALAIPGHLEALGPVGRVIAAGHILGAAAWVGGVVALALVVPVARRESGGAEAVSTVRRFALPALLAAGLVMASGIASLGGVLPTIAALAGAYGLVLAVKVGVAGCMTVIGFRNASALHAPAAAIRRTATASSQAVIGLPRTLRRARLSTRWIRMEAIAGVAVIAIAVALAATTQAGPQPGRAPSIASGSGLADDLVVNVEVRPLRFGPNFAAVSVLDTRRPSPGAVSSVEVRMSSPAGALASYAATDLGDGRWEVAQLQLDAGGAWQASVVVHRTGMPDAQLHVDLPVPEPPAAISAERPLAVPAAGLALVVAGALAVAGALLTRRRSASAPGRAIVAPVAR
jgi:copper transport protein